MQQWEHTTKKHDASTLESRFWLGRTLYQQEKYIEAESVFQEAVQEYERSLGPYRNNTLSSKYWLAVTLYEQSRYDEAENILRQVVDLEGKVDKRYGGMDESKFQLGRVLYQQKKYIEAEEMLQQSVQGMERSHGIANSDTLSGKYWLGLTLYEQEKYNDAEEILREVVQLEEKHEQRSGHILQSKLQLGRVLHQLEKFSEAEDVLRQAAHIQEGTIETDQKEVPGSVALPQELQKQQEITEEGQTDSLDVVALPQGPHMQEGIPQKDQQDISDSVVLPRRLQQREEEKEKYQMEALDTVSLPQELHKQEGIFEKYQENTVAIIDQLRGMHLKQSSPTTSSLTDVPAHRTLSDRLNSFFSDKWDRQTPFNDSEINEIAMLLQILNPPWSKVPRTYVVLRTIGHLKFLGDMIDVGFSDYWFPVTERQLPDCLQPSVRAAFVSAQKRVLSKSMDLERAEGGQHCFFQQGDSFPFERKEILGRGGTCVVDKVFSQFSQREYARKRMLRKAAFRGEEKEQMKKFIAEIEILKRLRHRHVVELVGSYTDTKYVGIIMSPVADMDLGGYLARTTATQHSELRTFFGCLANALEFLHRHKVRHKDIKPGNILVHAGNVLFADFGLSLDYTDANGSTTTGPPNGRTRKYCAPEVALHESRNKKSDIWSLGVVYMEMLAVLKGKSIQDMYDFFTAHGSKQDCIRTNPAALLEFVLEVKGLGKLADNKALDLTLQMLSEEQQSRPSSSSLVASFADYSKEGQGSDFCGTCCIPCDSEGFSD